MKMMAIGIHPISRNSRALVSGVGFSNGCAEFALNQPPPFVPRCLMLVRGATTPRLIICWPSDVADGVGAGVGSTAVADEVLGAVELPGAGAATTTGASAPLRVETVSAPLNVAGTPSATKTTPNTMEIGSMTRVTVRVRST